MLSVLALSAHEKCIIEFPYQSISSRVFENQPNSNERKGKEKKKGRGEGKEEGKKSYGPVALLVFIIATFEIVFGRKKLFDAKGPLGDNVIKNPARYI